MNNLEQSTPYQLGGAFLTGTNVFTPPTGKVVVAIKIHSTADFTTLTPVNDTGSNTYHIGTGVVAGATGNGTNAVGLGTNSVPAGQWIYGKWSTVTLNGGKVFLYFGQA